MAFPPTTAQHRRAVALVVSLTATALVPPTCYEQQLAALLAQGVLTRDEADALLANSIHQVLYHSQAAHAPTLTELQALLDWSRPYNAAHGITGLLLYSEGRYVQVLEGPKAMVEELYGRIRRDSRHTRVETLCQGPSRCRFSAWSMELGYVTPRHLEEALRGLQLRIPITVSDPRLQALLAAFI